MDFYQHLVVFLELRELGSREEREKGTLRLVSGIRPLCINFGWILLFFFFLWLVSSVPEMDPLRGVESLASQKKSVQGREMPSDLGFSDVHVSPTTLAKILLFFHTVRHTEPRYRNGRKKKKSPIGFSFRSTQQHFFGWKCSNTEHDLIAPE